jgi:hypothetical protein
VAEGIASGRGATFYAGDLIGGDIFRGSFRRGTAERLIDAPEGRMAVGMKFDRPSGLLFVAGGAGGLGYVYDVRTGDTVASYQLTGVPDSFVNDVAITRAGAWFTDSLQPQLYFVPISASGQPGRSRVLPLTARQPAGGRQRQVRHRRPAHRRAVRGRSVMGAPVRRWRCGES